MKVEIVKPMMLLPPAPGKCQECATEHDVKHPHNATSMFYQVKFKMENNREATWKDAMEHCSEEMKGYWLTELGRMGIDVESGKIIPKKTEWRTSKCKKK
jgi:hypothetical protein